MRVGRLPLVAVTLTLALLKVEADWQVRREELELSLRNTVFFDKVQLIPVGAVGLRFTATPLGAP
jgi:hypothetical protein